MSTSNFTWRLAAEDRRLLEQAVAVLRRRDVARREAQSLFAERRQPAPLLQTRDEWCLATFLRLVTVAAARMVLDAESPEEAELPHEAAKRVAESVEAMRAKYAAVIEHAGELELALADEGLTLIDPDDVQEVSGEEGRAA